MPVLVICRFDEDPIKNEGTIVSITFFHYMCMGKKNFNTQGLVTPKLIAESGPKSYLSETLCLFWLPARLKKIQSKLKVLLYPQHFFHYKSMRKIFNTQGLVTPKLLVGSGPQLNLSEILCLSWLPARLMKIQSKIKVLSYPYHFLQYKTMGKIFNHHFLHYRSMGKIFNHHFLPYRSMGKIFNAQGQVTPKRVVWSDWKSNESKILCLSLLPYLQVWWRSIQKGRCYLVHKIFSSAQGQVTPISEWLDLIRIRTHPRFYACPGYLQVWWRSDQKWRRYCVHNIFFIISLLEKFLSLKGKQLQRE